MDELGNDLEYREERIESKQPIKKHIPLKLKSGSFSSSNISGSGNQINIKPNFNNNNNNNINNPNTLVVSPNMKNDNLNKIPNQQSFDPFRNTNTINTNFDNTNKLISSFNFRTGVDDPKNQEHHQTNTIQNRRAHLISNMKWNFNVSTISQKIPDQPMDYCMICNLPILIYGRLIPCKHVMCIQCANSIDLKVCLKESCNQNIERIETVARGGIFVCTHDLDTNFGNTDQFLINPSQSQKKMCGRSYLSQRDLNSHYQHRHESNSMGY